MKWIVLVLAVLQHLETVPAARILALCVAASHSHSIWCYKYMEALAERGHQITVLGVDEPKAKFANLTTFIAKEVYDVVFTNTDQYQSDFKVRMIYQASKNWDQVSSKAVLHSQALKDLIQKYEHIEKPFDLIIHDHINAYAILGLVPLFGNPPLLLATTYGSPQWMTFLAGNVFNPAYVPSMISITDQHMTFYERCVNTFYYVFLEWYTRFVAEPFHDELMREVFGSHLPHVRDIAKRANIIIVNHHFALNEPRPLLPGVIGIAGLHVSEPQPLPQDIKNFVDNAKDGVILFSFGSNVKSTWLPEDFETTVLGALQQLPQRVLWKWDKVPANIPANVKISKWLPQGDILAHPKIRLFVSHCGLLSMQEALYHRVPVLALPVFLDQTGIASVLVKHNLSIKLNIHTLTSDQLREGIQHILTNPIFKQNTEHVGELMQDMPETSRQRAVFWTEYAIRHQGAAHLHSAAADLSWPQLLLLDVLGLLLLLLVVSLWLIKVAVVFVYRRLTFTKIKHKAENN